jgi:hypothetical protein
MKRFARRPADLFLFYEFAGLGTSYTRRCFLGGFHMSNFLGPNLLPFFLVLYLDWMVNKFMPGLQEYCSWWLRITEQHGRHVNIFF